MYKYLLLPLLTLLGACTGNVRVADNQSLPPIATDKAQIVFMRSTTVNALVNTVIYDVTAGTPLPVGNIPNGSKVVTHVPPGDHVFMVGNNDYRDFMRASVLPNKRYYVVITAYWPARFSFRPFRHDNSEFIYATPRFKDLLSDTKIVLETEESRSSGESSSKLDYFYKNSWPKWEAKNPEQKAILTLNPKDYLE